MQEKNTPACFQCQKVEHCLLLVMSRKLKLVSWSVFFRRGAGNCVDELKVTFLFFLELNPIKENQGCQIFLV
jgi:hypothetical protein